MPRHRQEPRPDPVTLEIEPEHRLPGQHPQKVRARSRRLALVERDGEDHHPALLHSPHRGRIIEQKRTMRADVDDRPASSSRPGPAVRLAAIGMTTVLEKSTSPTGAGGARPRAPRQRADPGAATRGGGGVVTGAGPAAGDGGAGGWILRLEHELGDVVLFDLCVGRRDRRRARRGDALDQHAGRRAGTDRRA